jgi:hypothetical protein
MPCGGSFVILVHICSRPSGNLWCGRHVMNSLRRNNADIKQFGPGTHAHGTKGRAHAYMYIHKHTSTQCHHTCSTSTHALSGLQTHPPQTDTHDKHTHRHKQPLHLKSACTVSFMPSMISSIWSIRGRPNSQFCSNTHEPFTCTRTRTRTLRSRKGTGI